MKKYLFFIGIIFFLNSCSTNIYEQSYSTYQAFEKANQRNKGWFPAWINNSCSNLINRSSLSNNESIGKFTYSKTGNIDSILSEKGNAQQINTNAFQIMLVDMKTEMPDWFITKEKIVGKSIWQKDGFWLAKDTLNRQIYFLCKGK
ncbi:MAG: hypothetical protein RIQ33_2188 [Bacteroidota bacterium]|jgi:PBP1b-binding outer membrane lipoprotein LpoB